MQETLGELAGPAREGLLALIVGVELGVWYQLMEAELDEVVGPKGPVLLRDPHDQRHVDARVVAVELAAQHVAGVSVKTLASKT